MRIEQYDTFHVPLRTFLQHAVLASLKRQKQEVVQTDTAGCGWTPAAL